MKIRDLSDKQLVRVWNKIHDKIRYWSEGDPYGWDLPTLWFSQPGLAKAYVSVRDEGKRRDAERHVPKPESTHFVKCREIGKTRWKFIAAGGVSHLRVHASRFTKESAERLIKDNSRDNPEWEFKAVAIN